MNGLEQIVNNYPAERYSYVWEEEIQGLQFEDDQVVCVLTYAKFGAILERIPDFYKVFDYIICDELHSLIYFENFSPKPNVHYSAHNGLVEAVQSGHTTVIALTATPAKVIKYFGTPSNLIDIDKEQVYHYETREIIPYSSIDEITKNLDPNQVGLCYTKQITMMKELEEIFEKHGIKTISIWSIRNQEHIMNEEQLRVREQILHHFTLPSEYKMLIINSSCETSIKIKSHIDYVIVHCANRDTQIQVRGRVCDDISTLYLPRSLDDCLVVPNEYLGIKLFAEDKEKLCQYFHIRNRNSRLYRWPTIKNLLIDSDYCLTEARENNKRYVIITRGTITKDM